MQSGEENFGDDVSWTVCCCQPGRYRDRLTLLCRNSACTSTIASACVFLASPSSFLFGLARNCQRANARADPHALRNLQGEFILVVDAPLSACPRRPADGSFALVNTGSNPRIYKLNVSEQGKGLVPPSTIPGAPAAGAAGKYGNGVLVNRGGGFEFQSESGAISLLLGLPLQDTVPSMRELVIVRPHRLMILLVHRTTVLPAVSAASGVRNSTRRGSEGRRDVHLARSAPFLPFV